MNDEDESDVEMEGMDMDDDEPAEADDSEEADVMPDGSGENEGDAKEMEGKVDEHELEELEAARKERMDLMYVRYYYACVVICSHHVHNYFNTLHVLL